MSLNFTHPAHSDDDALVLGRQDGRQGRVLSSQRKPDDTEDHTNTGCCDIYTGTIGAMQHSVTLLAVDDYTNKYKGEQVEVALFGGEYQEGVLTAYCSFEDVPHVELNGHILIPLQNVASLHCSSRCDAPEPDWPPRGFIEDDTGES
jgi:hypothetical protein